MTHSSGAYWEERARQLVVSKGGTIIARNFSCRLGEIDLIALDSERLAFIEVRYVAAPILAQPWRGVSGQAAEGIHGGQIFLASHRDYCNRYCRFDIIAFDGPRDRTSPQWLKGAFGSAEHPNYE